MDSSLGFAMALALSHIPDNGRTSVIPNMNVKQLFMFGKKKTVAGFQ